MTLLELKGVCKSFGGLAAVFLLDLEVHEGEILGLVGPNGAGKTTVFNLITGFLSPDAGKILLKGERISGRKPYKIASKGIARTFQISTLFKNCTVLENVVTGHHLQIKAGFWDFLLRTRRFWQEESEVEEKAVELLDFVRLTEYKDILAKNLSHGHQQRLGIIIALSTKPVLLLLDEPFAGMDSRETQEMMRLVDKIRRQGATVLIIEHDMKAVMGMCDRVVVLNYGKKLAEGVPEEIQNNKEVIEAYLGREDDTA